MLPLKTKSGSLPSKINLIITILLIKCTININVHYYKKKTGITSNLNTHLINAQPQISTHPKSESAKGTCLNKY